MLPYCKIDLIVAPKKMQFRAGTLPHWWKCDKKDSVWVKQIKVFCYIKPQNKLWINSK